MKRVAIIGGGISGLATAYYLLRKVKEDNQKIELVLLEKQSRVGGSILTERVEGFLIEGGPDCFVSDKPWTIKLARELGIEDRLLESDEKNRRTYIFSKGRLHPLPEGFLLLALTNFGSFLRSSLISWPGKIRLIFDLLIPPRRIAGDESLANFVRRRLGKEILDKIAEPLIAGIHAGDPETMSLKSTFPRFLQLEQKYGSVIRGMLAQKKERRKSEEGKSQNKTTYFMSFKDGMIEIINSLVEVVGKKKLFLETDVQQVTREVDPSTGKSFYVLHIKGKPSLKADVVVLATPAFVSARLLRDLDSSLSRKLAEIPYVSSATVSLAYPQRAFPHSLKGFGFVVPQIEQRRIMATTWCSSKFSHRAPEGHVLLRSFVGGAGREHYLELDDQDLVKLVQAELKEIMDIDSEPLLTRVYRWEKAMPQYTLGHLERVISLEEIITRDHLGLFLVGSAYHGIGINDCIHQGELIAEQIREYLS